MPDQQRDRGREQGQGQEFIQQGKIGVVEPRLAAAHHSLLLQPVAQAAHHPGLYPRNRRKKIGVERQGHEPEPGKQDGQVSVGQGGVPPNRAQETKKPGGPGQPDAAEQTRDHQRGRLAVVVHGHRLAPGQDQDKRCEKRSHQDPHDDGGVREAAGGEPGRALGPPNSPAGATEAEEPENGPGDERILLADQGSQHACRQEIQPAADSGLDVANQPQGPQQTAERHVDVVADVPAVKQQRRADGQQDCCQQGSATAQDAAEPPKRRHRGGAHQGRKQPGREIRRSKQQIQQGVHMEQERAVHHGIVAVVEGVHDVPRVQGMEAFVMRERAVAQPRQAHA